MEEAPITTSSDTGIRRDTDLTEATHIRPIIRTVDIMATCPSVAIIVAGIERCFRHGEGGTPRGGAVQQAARTQCRPYT